MKYTGKKAIALAACVAATAVPGAAHAAAPTLIRASAATGADSSQAKSGRAYCPSGMRAISGGAAIEGGLGGQPPNSTTQVFLTKLKPVGPQHGAKSYFEAAAHEDDNGYNGHWRLRVYAVCAKNLTGVTYRSVSMPEGSPFTETANVTCPAGKVSLGTGGRIENGGGDVILTELGLSEFGTFANAYEDEDGTSRRWRVTGYAVCADPPTGYSAEIGGQPLANSASPKSPTLTCLNPAQRVFGMAFGNGGKTNKVLPYAAAPTPALDKGVASAAENETGLADPWDLDLFLACAD